MREVETTGEVPPSLTPWVTRTEAQLSALRAEGLFRERAVIQPLGGLKVEVDGEQLTLFSSNDYLGLSSHPTVRTAAADAASRLGTGPRGSALICGHTAEHAALEAELARLADTESALLCPTGFAANLVVCEALAGPDVAIFSDALNHASIIEGTRLARRRGAKVIVYPHGDVEALARAHEGGAARPDAAPPAAARDADVAHRRHADPGGLAVLQLLSLAPLSRAATGRRRRGSSRR